MKKLAFQALAYGMGDLNGTGTACLITWVCYGAWLHGQSGAVRRGLNRFGAPFPEPDAGRAQQSGARMVQEPYRLDALRRQIVLQSLTEVCACRNWPLWAAHVRTNHVHVVTTAHCRPEHAMSVMKAYSSRALNNYGLDGPERRRWARHGSTRYLWTAESIRAVIQYVVCDQGECMAVFERPWVLGQ